MVRCLSRFAALFFLLLAAAIAFLEVSERRGSFVRRYLLNEESPSATLSVATVALGVGRDPEANRGRMVGLVERIVREHPEVELIHFGEASLGWFYDPPNTEAYQRGISEPIPGPTTEEMSRLAGDHRVFISFGLTEADGDRLFNSQVLLGPDGSIRAVQRKKNLKSDVFSSGPVPVTFVDVGGVRVALVICFDVQAEETRRLVLNEQPDLVLLSNADWTERWDRIGFGQSYQARRYRSWFVSANRFGVEGELNWDGHVEIVSPMGDILASGVGREQYLFYRLPLDLDPSRSKAAARAIYTSVSFPYFVLRHAHTAFGYVTEGSPGKAWLAVGIGGVVVLLLLTLMVGGWIRRRGRTI